MYQKTEEDIVNASSKNIYEIVKSFGKHAELYVDCQMRHGLDAGAANYQSDFGTGFTNDTDVLGYMAGRTATFFQAVMHPSIVTPVSLANTLFIECINSRKQCNVPNSPCPGQHVSCVIID